MCACGTESQLQKGKNSGFSVEVNSVEWRSLSGFGGQVMCTGEEQVTEPVTTLRLTNSQQRQTTLQIIKVHRSYLLYHVRKIVLARCSVSYICL